MPTKLLKIVSGGQTGADRAAWDAAIEAGIEISGFVPLGEKAEDGPIPLKYSGLIETGSEDPQERTRLNVINSDATLVFTHDPPIGGTRLTIEAAKEYEKPLLHIDLSAVKQEKAIEGAVAWIAENDIAVLNIAGPRASEDPAIYEHTLGCLRSLLRAIHLMKNSE